MIYKQCWVIFLILIIFYTGRIEVASKKSSNKSMNKNARIKTTTVHNHVNRPQKQISTKLGSDSDDAKVGTNSVKTKQKSAETSSKNELALVVANNNINSIKNWLNGLEAWRNHDYFEMSWLLKYYNMTCASWTHLYSIGQTVQNRKLWVLAIGKNPSKHTPGIPEVKLIANVHGNEIAGKELLIYLIQYICKSINRNKELTQLFSKIRLHILPSLNPDGYEMARKSNFTQRFIGRLNSNGVDINRNFPDQFFPTNQDLEPETQAVINWIKEIPFMLSISFHDGALVVSYPYDDSPSGQTKYSATPDDDIMRKIALSYSENHPSMHQSDKDSCSNSHNKRFVGGITNGAEWSSISNSMQDYNYVFSNCFEITVELTCKKNITSADHKEIFEENQKSIIDFIKTSQKGIKGFVYSEDGQPIQGAIISVNDRRHNMETALDGDYWRILFPGTYEVTASAKGYNSQPKIVTVDDNAAIQLNFTLTRKALDMSLFTLGHVSAAKKLSNTINFEWDGRDSEDTILTDERNKFAKEQSNLDSESILNDRFGDTSDEYIQKQLKKFKNDMNRTTLLGTSEQMAANLDKISNFKIINQNNNQNETVENYNKQIGDLVKCLIASNSKQIIGHLRWKGYIDELKKSYDQNPQIYGIELLEDDPLGTDGVFLGKRYFYTDEKKAYFVPSNSCN